MLQAEHARGRVGGNGGSRLGGGDGPLDSRRTGDAVTGWMGSKTRAFFKRWVSPPFYKGDEIRTVRARLLNSTTISTLSFLALLLIGNSLGGRIPASVMLLDFSMIAVVTLVHVLLRRGMIAFAGIALTTLGFKPDQPVTQAAAFVVSLEKKGGVPKAEGPIVLLGK